MPIREPTFKSSLTSEVSGFIAKKRKQNQKQKSSEEGDVEFLNILEFIDRFKLFPDGLFPAQRFIIKLYYNIPLDNTVKDIQIAGDRLPGSEIVGFSSRHEVSAVVFKNLRFQGKVLESPEAAKLRVQNASQIRFEP